MDALETLSKVSNAITEEPVKIEVEVEPQNWLHAWLQKGKWSGKFFPKTKVLFMHPIRMGSLIRISRLVLTIDKSVLNQLKGLKNNFENTAFSHEIITNHGETLIQVVAMAIHNRKSDPPKWLVEMIRNQFAPKALLEVLMAVLRMMDTQNFTLSIISIRGLNILEMNPQTQGSSIAPGTSSEEL
jgi:hypothetical protein